MNKLKEEADAMLVVTFPSDVDVCLACRVKKEGGAETSAHRGLFSEPHAASFDSLFLSTRSTKIESVKIRPFYKYIFIFPQLFFLVRLFFYFFYLMTNRLEPTVEQHRQGSRAHYSP